MLSHESVKVWHVIVLLFAFWGMWLYTDHKTRQSHEEFFSEVNEFIHKGDRFTAADGRALKARVKALEEQMEKQND